MPTKYSIIYIDPPYKFQNWTEKKNGSPVQHYSPLTNEEIQNLKIGEISEKNAAIFLWMPSVKIIEGLHVKFFESWDFRPVSVAFVWRKLYKSGKPYTGIGFWTRNDSEFCLLGIKGRMDRKSTKVLQTIESPVVRPHSTKPPIVRDKIIELLGDLPRIELFARPPLITGWDMLGLEIDGKDIRDALKEII